MLSDMDEPCIPLNLLSLKEGTKRVKRAVGRALTLLGQRLRQTVVQIHRRSWYLMQR